VSNKSTVVKNMLIRSALIMAIALTLLATSTLLPVTHSLAQDQSLTNRTSGGLIDLIILDVNASVPEDRNIYTVIGKVLNNDTVPFNGVRVSVTLYDNEGQSLVERSAYTSPSGIQPGTNASFNINIFGTSINDGMDTISNFTLRVTGDRQAQLFQ
jgi:hypothetical protein